MQEKKRKQYLVTAAEMQRYDKQTIERIGIPAMVLMERAALETLHYIQTHFSEGSALILAGVGNNGGDGLALARLLLERGWQVEIWCVGNQKKASAQWQEQYHILENGMFFGEDTLFSSIPRQEEYTIMIDALFGVGLSREITGEWKEAVSLFNRIKGYKIALDLPSGIHADTGSVLGTAVRADATVTYGFAKRGLFLFPGREYAGKTQTADIGITERSFFGTIPEVFTYAVSPGELLPERTEDGNKGTFGKVLVVAGSVNMAGAAILASRAAYRAGAGMVKVITPEENRVILQTAVPEALFGTEQSLQDGMEWADVFVAGPGLGRGEMAQYCLERVIAYGKKPLVLDADGLNLLAKAPALQEKLALQGREGRKLILTPHVGELARLTGSPISETKQNLLQQGKQLAEKLHAVVVAKDAATFVCGEEQSSYLNCCGNSGMATAGSGDVLAGITGTLLAQTEDAFETALTAVYLHGKAGELASERKGKHGCMAGDIAEALGSL